MTKAIIFDCFGVLVRDGWLPFCEKHFGHNLELMEQASLINRRSDAGLISYNDFVTDVAELAGIDFETALSEIETNPPNQALFAMIRDQLKPNYKLGILSNASDDWLSTLLEPWQLELFDGVALSYEIGAIKPAPAAYGAIASRLDLAPSDCLMIDDRALFCNGAEHAGMQAILYEDTIQLAMECEKYNIILKSS